MTPPEEPTVSELIALGGTGGQFHPIAFNWQSGGDCRLNPSTTGTDALTVSQLPAVFVPQGGTIVHDSAHEGQDAAIRSSSEPQDSASYTVGGDTSTYGWVVRKLSPLECERLMGWPDNYTAIGITDEGVEVKIPKTSRYKICGNGIVSPITEWIGSRIMEVCNEP
jgi:DNA (cytosine-5)-methyltransferase 1